MSFAFSVLGIRGRSKDRPYILRNSGDDLQCCVVIYHQSSLHCMSFGGRLKGASLHGNHSRIASKISAAKARISSNPRSQALISADATMKPSVKPRSCRA